MIKYKRKRKRFTFKKATFISFLFLVILFFLTRMYFQPPVMVYAKQKSLYHASLLINNAVNEQIVPNIDTNKIIYIETKSNGYVSSVILDVYQVNFLLAKMTKQIQQQIIELENDESSDLNNISIPLGMIFDNPILNNIGPNIKIRLKSVGSVHTDIVSKVVPYGINNSLIEISIKTVVKFEVIMPYRKGEIQVVTHTPLLIKIVQGDIPHYYYTGGNGSFSNPPSDNSGETGDN